jgi:stage II sporulation protein D
MSARLGRRTFLLAGSTGAAALLLPSWLSSPSSASAQGNEKSGLTRVLVRRPDGSVDASTLVVTGDGEFAATDAKGERVGTWSARTRVTVGREGDTFWLHDGDKEKKVAGLAGPLKFNGTGDGAPLRNQATSGPEPTSFRGTLEVTASPEGRVALVNVLGIEEYLYGVVTKELPALFGQEPLKAQAVAARTYMLARKQAAPHKNQSADICDTQHCQAFGGLAGEHPLGRTAVDATRGVVMLHGGTPFQPFYSSACGGHTEAASSIFGAGDARDLDAVQDGEIPSGAKLSTDDGALRFFKSNWDSNCAGSNRYRWSYAWDAEQLKATVSAGLARFQGTPTVATEGDARVELLENVSIPERGASGRALSIRFEAPGVSWSVKRDWGIRNFLRTPAGELLPSSAMAIEIERGPDKKLEKLTVYGAGWGHGAGMCQWGTKGLAARGLDFQGILAHYYPSAELGKA